ncbi:hypothetical protein L1987_77393 [Smallanthus sonchifolius]|uniref:Uncharacterized protein n=1 Tax=Smallanthus sonchifolius TaxID=185202 RepID=A0ACB8ZAR4_9ASTR|nr:hypothetical protein L1987_77393 [Smallanthus sonchifolius]
MSVAFESNNSCDGNRIRSPVFSHGTWIYNMPESIRLTGGNPWTTSLPVVKEEEDSSRSSSIGKDSDALSGGGDSDEDDGEVQSKDNRPLNDLNDLEKVLPIKRGISMFYDGKSKSYGSLADAISVPSIQGIVKPEDAYSRKRKNMLAHHALLNKHLESTTKSGSRSSLTLGLNSHSHDKTKSSESRSSTLGLSLPPLPRKSMKLSTNESSVSSPKLYRSPWRSLSLSNLQHASSITGS